MNSYSRIPWAFGAVALLALAALWFTLELRYAWFLEGAPVTTLRAIEVVSIVGIVSLWYWFPSRTLVAALAALSFALPPLIDANSFVALDLPMSLGALVVVALLVLATHLKARKPPVAEHAL
jgi:hypothetical protein